jgi:peptidyl-tRNA hydrolase
MLKDNPYNQEIPDEVIQVVADQIKEKFGTLRFYYHGGDNTIHGMVQMAESISTFTCEKCGASGKLRGAGWLYTACDNHTNEGDL